MFMKQFIKVLNAIIGTFLIIGIIEYLIYLSPNNENYNKQVVSNLQSQKTQPMNMNKHANVITHGNVEKPYIVEAIPSVYYERSSARDQFYNVLNSNRKVIFIMYPKQSYMTYFFKRKFEKELAKNTDKYYYYYLAYEYDKDFEYRCTNKNPYCAPRYLSETCTDKLCIVNPRKRQTLILPKLNANLAISIIEEYKNW